MKKKVSLKDIAQKVGVSTALVSYVLNNKKVNRISKEVAAKIQDAARELNYRTNQIARSLKTNRTYTIGLIVADISNSFWSGLARIIEDEADKHNYSVIFGSSDESAEKSLKLINLFLNHQVDGIIVALAGDASEQIKFLQENEIPYVLIDRYVPDVDASYVAIDNYKAAYRLVKHVIEKGLQRIGFITFASSQHHLQERKRGYAAALKDNKLTGRKSWIKEVSNTNAAGEVAKAIDELLAAKEPIEAILFASNELSMYGLKHIHQLNIKVPDQLALLSFDESDAADLFYAPLTHIKQPVKEMGEMATRILLETITKNNKVTQVNLEPAFIVRKSTAVKPVKG